MLNRRYDLGWGGLRQQHCGNLILENGLILYHLIACGRDALINSLNEARVYVTGCCASSQCAACSCSRHDHRHRVARCTVVVIDLTFKHMVHVVGGYSVSQPCCRVSQLHQIETAGIRLVDERLQDRVRFDQAVLSSVEFSRRKDVQRHE